MSMWVHFNIEHSITAGAYGMADVALFYMAAHKIPYTCIHTQNQHPQQSTFNASLFIIRLTHTLIMKTLCCTNLGTNHCELHWIFFSWKWLFCM